MKLVSSRPVGQRHVYDIEVADYHNFVANGVVVHNCTQRGAQRFFQRVKPRSIIDIAALTSIYRPGPLAAKVDDLYVDAKNGKQFDWGDERINKILAKTHGLLIFQEQVMELANKVAGFPLDECDKLRKAIMKRTISGGDEAKKKAAALRDSFVDGAVKNGYERASAEKIYERIAWMSGYGFNAAHAVSYAIDSYYCAWLMTYHEEEWLSAYLESMSSNPDDRAKAFAEVRGLGYKIANVDVNYANRGWTALPDKRFMPSFGSFKGIGDTAIDEIVERRPFKDVESMLWNPDGSWRPSKFNKKSMEALILVGGFDSLGCVGPDKLFANYRHMHSVIIGCWDDIKKSSKRNPFQGRDAMRAVALATADCEDWTREERLSNVVSIVGTADVTMLVPPRIMDKIAERGIPSVDELDDEQSDVAWFCVKAIIPRRSKNGKPYSLVEAIGPVGRTHRVYAWNGVGDLKPLQICIAPLERSQFGFSATRIVVLA